MRRRCETLLLPEEHWDTRPGTRCSGHEPKLWYASDLVGPEVQREPSPRHAVESAVVRRRSYQHHSHGTEWLLPRSLWSVLLSYRGIVVMRIIRPCIDVLLNVQNFFSKTLIMHFFVKNNKCQQTFIINIDIFPAVCNLCIEYIFLHFVQIQNSSPLVQLSAKFIYKQLLASYHMLCFTSAIWQSLF